MKHPECEKMLAVREDSQKIGEFLEWLESKKITFFEWKEREYNEEMDEYIPEESGYCPYHYDMESLLAEFFGIDLDKVEQERRQILDEIRSKQ